MEDPRTTEQRKDEHLRVHLEHSTAGMANPWDGIRLRHEAFLETDLADVELSTSFLGYALKAPLLLTGMTGGAQKAKVLNGRLAEAASEHQIAMGVGSQRAGLSNPDLASTYNVILDYDVPLRIGNLGMSQLIEWGPERESFLHRAVDMIDAHVLAIHLNPLQEAMMPEGEPRGRGAFEALQATVEESPVPILVKETGAGMDGRTFLRLQEAGVAAVDVGGQGGTSFSVVESQRAKEQGHEALAERGQWFADWGLATPDCIQSCKSAGVQLPIVATGGLRHGLDAAKALHLGADLAGFAGAALHLAHGDQAVVGVANWLEALKAAHWLSGQAEPARREDLP